MATASMNLGQLTQALGSLGKPVNWTPLLKKIRQVLIAGTKENFDREENPDGVRWPPLKQPRRGKRHRRRHRKGLRDKILNDTGLLRGSVTANKAHHVEIETPTSIEWGTNLIYSAVHQFGYPPKNIPKREYLGISADMADDILDLAEEFIADEIVKRLT